MASFAGGDTAAAAAPNATAEAPAAAPTAKAKAAPFDATTKKVVQKIPLLKTRAGPRDGDKWTQRLKEEYQALIRYASVCRGARCRRSGNRAPRFDIRPDGRCWLQDRSRPAVSSL